MPLHIGLGQKAEAELLAAKLLDEMENLVKPGGKIIDWHSCEIFPERWVDLVIVVRCDHSRLWERLEKR